MTLKQYLNALCYLVTSTKINVYTASSLCICIAWKVLTVFRYKGVISSREAEERSPNEVYFIVVSGISVVVMETGVAKLWHRHQGIKFCYTLYLEGENMCKYMCNRG